MPLERELPHRLRRSSLLGRSLLQDDLLYIAALIDLWLLHCYKTPPTLVGGHSVHPSAPSSSREQRDRRILRGAQTRRGALRAPAFPTKVSLVLERANEVRPYGFDKKDDCKCWWRSPHTPRVKFNGYREYGLRAYQNTLCLTTKFCEQKRVLT